MATGLPTANGVNATKRAAIIAKTAGISDFIDGANEWGTKLRVCFDKYTVPTDYEISIAAVVTMGRVPKGARVLGFEVSNTTNAGGATTADLQLVDAAGNITAATADELWTTMGTARGVFIPALSGVQATVLDEEHTVTFTTLTAVINAAVVLTVSTFYVLED